MERIIKILEMLRTDMKIDAETRLIDDGVLDSLDMVAFVSDVNEEFGINIGAEHLIPENFQTPRDVLRLVQALGGI